MTKCCPKQFTFTGGEGTSHYCCPEHCCKPKRHEIKTLQDIMRAVTPENQEAFIKDFETFLTLWMVTKTTIELTAPKSLEKTIETAKFVWIDDEKHDIKVSIGFIPENDEKRL